MSAAGDFAAGPVTVRCRGNLLGKLPAPKKMNQIGTVLAESVTAVDRRRPSSRSVRARERSETEVGRAEFARAWR